MFMDDFFGGGRKRPSLKQWKELLHPKQGGKCMYCGHKLRLGDGQVDHKMPFSRGGKETPANMQLLCAPCNTRKGDLSDGEFKRRFKSVLPAKLPPSPAISLSKFEAVAKTVATKKATAAKKRRANDPFGLW
ncbi:MAG: HNH endonuclease signature motif containing protein [Chloroflexota bacterium]|nr:HNH endonuclease signature motif containing protein [Chloroflexota bacterium]